MKDPQWKVDYSQNWNDWINIAERQHAKDIKLFVPLLKHLPSNGKILEIGSGVGQLTALAKSAGYNVIASDVESHFIDYMNKNGIEAQFIDALDIKSCSNGIEWDAIFAQGASPLISNNLDIVRKAYQSIYDALKPEGLFLFIEPRGGDAGKYSYIYDHRDIYLSCGFSEQLVSRQQVLPAPLYKYAISMVPEGILGRFFGTRDIILLQKDAE